MARDPAVLIIDENDDSRVELRKLLARAGLSVCGEARYGASATSAAVESKPDAIVVGIEEPTNRALETIESLANLLLETPIIGYSSLTDAGAIRRATRAGLRDYLVRPLASEAVHEAVFTALEQEERRQLRRAGHHVPAARGSVITVTGAKGGVGKSVIAINLALALRSVTGRSVALVDADTHFGDVATMLNLPRTEPVTEVIGIADQLDRASLVEHMVEHPSGVRVLPGPAVPEDWDNVSLDNLERVLGLLGEAFDFVVIDTPDVMDAVVKQCVFGSTVSLLVTSLDLSSIADTRAALHTFQRWESPAEKVRLVVNPIRKKNGIRPADVQQSLNWPLFWALPYETRVPQAAQLGESIIVAAPKSRFSRHMIDLALVISGKKNPKVGTVRVSAVRRIFGWLPTPVTSG